jgi:hypothetical protein
MALNNWNAGDVDYWDTTGRRPAPGEAAAGATDWGKILGKIVLVLLAVPGVLIAVYLLLCLLMFIYEVYLACRSGC